MDLRQFLNDTEVAGVVEALAEAAKDISALIGRNGLENDLGSEIGKANKDGDTQKALDIKAEEIITQKLQGTEAEMLLSEETEKPLPINQQGSLIVAVDPLDGSSNISVNVTIGTIFSILPKGEILQKGRNQLAAGFFTYGPQTTLILATAKSKARCFILDTKTGDFVEAGEAHISDETNEYAINAAYAKHWFEPITQWMEEALNNKSKSYRMRWVGSLVADAWRIFQRGGIFLYPGDARKGYEQGRLRLIYEANPIAFLTEKAGGVATDGSEAILDITPQDLHQRTPLIFGASSEVKRLIDLHTKFASER